MVHIFMWMQFREIFLVLLYNVFESGAFFSLFHINISSSSLYLTKCSIIMSVIFNFLLCYSEANSITYIIYTCVQTHTHMRINSSYALILIGFSEIR